MIRLLAALLLLLPTLALDAEAVVTRVTDGDTIEVGGPKVRLQGIDAPESNQPHGNQVTAALKGLILNRRVRLEIHETDRYDHLITVVYSEGRDVNHWLVEPGHAWEYDKYSKDAAVGRREREARVADRGCTVHFLYALNRTLVMHVSITCPLERPTQSDCTASSPAFHLGLRTGRPLSHPL